MNKIYRVIWNHTLRVFQVCSELVNGKHQVSSVSQTVSPLPCLKNTLFADPLPSRLRVLSLLVLMALPGTSFAELVVDSSLGTPNLTITQDNPYADGGNIIVGGISGGTGELTISNGGTVTGGASTAGLLAGSSGTITVDGTGSVLNTVSMTVGHAGDPETSLTGTLTLPFGLALTEGISLSADEKPLQTLKFSTCLPEGCVVPVQWDKEQVKILMNAGKWTLTGKNSGVSAEKIELQLPVNGLDKALQRIQFLQAKKSDTPPSS